MNQYPEKRPDHEPAHVSLDSYDMNVYVSAGVRTIDRWLANIATNELARKRVLGDG